MKTVLEYLEYSAAVRPHAVAVEDAGGTATFQELEVGCRKVGSALTERIALREPVAIFLEKGRQALWAFWGTVYAGGFYVPLNPDLPPARLRQIQSVLQANYVITDRAHRVRALEIFSPEAILDVEELLAAPLQPARLEAVRSQVVDTDPLYTNFTSGSTGQPKGVVVSHRSVIDFIDTFVDCFGMDHTDILANQAPFDFDVSVKDLYTMLKTGAKLSVVPKELFSRPKELLDWLCDRKVTSLTWAVSALCLISTFHGLDYRVPETVRRVLFSGEVMPEKHLRAWRTHLPEAVFGNLYGPTEITCNCTYHILEPDRLLSPGHPHWKALPQRAGLPPGPGRPGHHHPWRRGGDLRGGHGPGPGVLPGPGGHGGCLCPQPHQPLLAGAHLPHRRPGTVRGRGGALLPGTEGLSDQIPGPPHRAGGDRAGGGQGPGGGAVHLHL